MKTNRRQFLGAAAATGALSLLPTRHALAAEPKVTDAMLEQAAAKPVLRIEGLKDPVVIESIQLLRKGRNHFVRVRSKDGAEGISVDDGRMDVLHPILNRLIIPYFIGKDARDLEEHLFQAYRYQSNYKLLGLALWAPVALVEFAILDMFGRMTNKPLGALVGDIVRTTMPFYVASGRRDTTPEQEIDYLKT
jgi:L-alanine-DL-glutamate epimerase-like enolase superfamily enzyme